MTKPRSEVEAERIEHLLDVALEAARKGDEATVLRALQEAEAEAGKLPKKGEPPEVIYLPGPQAS